LLQKTLFGWIIGDKYPSNSTWQGTIHCNASTISANLDRAIERFWELAQFSIKPVLTAEERECEEHFEKTHYRTDKGRFVMKLPIKRNSLHTLGHSYDVALKRFHSLERKLNRNPDMKKAYTQFMQEYLDLEHMHPVNPETQCEAPTYYMPHHAVFKNNSLISKTRVVFDASSKTQAYPLMTF